VWRGKLAVARAVAVLAGMVAFCPAWLLGDDPTVTVWLMPSEPADEHPTPAAMTDDEAIDEFCSRFPSVTILNAKIPFLRAQLIAWNQEFAEATWPMLKGQTGTLETLEGFAEEHRVRVRFRLESWGNALRDLQDEKDRPDLVEVGSTWVAFLAAHGMIRPAPQDTSPHPLLWRRVPGHDRASLYYTTDLRLIFYWRRPLSEPANSPPFEPRSGNWQDFLESLEKYVTGEKRSAAMVLPIGITPNLLHDLVPLVWAGESDFYLDKWRTHVDLTSKEALLVPLMLAKRAVVTRAGQPYRVLAFPEMDHEEATRHFMGGDYVAAFEPAAFVRRWFDNFVQHAPKPATPQAEVAREREFWSRAGVAALPETFKGGSDLVVLNGTRAAERAFSLARFLVQDPQFTGLMSRIGWLPAQLSDHGVQALNASLWYCESNAALCQDLPNGLTQFDSALDFALKNGREYPPYAKWPAAFESRDTLDALQTLWRAIAEANEDGAAFDTGGITSAAREVQSQINRQIDWLAITGDYLERGWILIAPPSIAILIALLWYQHRLKNLQNGKILALRLYSSLTHSLLQAFGGRVREFRLLPEEKLRSTLLDYGTHIAECFNTHLKHTANDVALEVEAGSRPLDLQTVLTQAYDGAKAEFKAATATSPAEVTVVANGVQEWEVYKSASLLVVVLQEWFDNCLSALYYHSICQARIAVDVERRGVPAIQIVSPVPISEEQANKFRVESPSLFARIHDRLVGKKGQVPAGGRGIPLIRDLLWYGFNTRADCRPTDLSTILTIPLPVLRRKHK
jgi:hypothetical protein